jgi:hypothetical protein
MNISRIKRIHKNIKQRCLNVNCPHYYNYGGRGIKICKEWMKLKCFREWVLSSDYQDGLTIDRRDNNGNYCPENCHWITKKEQASNKRCNVNVTIWGETKNTSKWGKDNRCVVSRRTLERRVKKGWDTELAITTPDKDKHGKPRFIIAWGETKRICEWVKDHRCKVTRDALKSRLKKGIVAEEAISIPSNPNNSKPRKSRNNKNGNTIESQCSESCSRI